MIGNRIQLDGDEQMFIRPAKSPNYRELVIQNDGDCECTIVIEMHLSAIQELADQFTRELSD